MANYGRKKDFEHIALTRDSTVASVFCGRSIDPRCSRRGTEPATSRFSQAFSRIYWQHSLKYATHEARATPPPLRKTDYRHNRGKSDVDNAVIKTAYGHCMRAAYKQASPVGKLSKGAHIKLSMYLVPDSQGQSTLQFHPAATATQETHYFRE